MLFDRCYSYISFQKSKFCVLEPSSHSGSPQYYIILLRLVLLSRNWIRMSNARHLAILCRNQTANRSCNPYTCVFDYNYSNSDEFPLVPPLNSRHRFNIYPFERGYGVGKKPSTTGNVAGGIGGLFVGNGRCIVCCRICTRSLYDKRWLRFHDFPKIQRFWLWLCVKWTTADYGIFNKWTDRMLKRVCLNCVLVPTKWFHCEDSVNLSVSSF